VITGGNGAIAGHLARYLTSEGHRVILWTRESDDREFPFPCERITADLTDYDAAFSAWDEFRSADDLPDALVHTAAIRAFDHQCLRDSDPVIWNHVVTSNLVMAANILRVLLPDLSAHKPGRVVLFGSDVSVSGLARGSAYAAAKAGLVGLCRSVAKEEPDIRINVVSPGPVQTGERSDSDDYREFRRVYFEEQRKLIPLGRLATPEDVCGLVRFLISPENTFLTGEEIMLTGGRF
jgi:3-oxoacyl-[acyl-carrier protein] reductase